MFGRQLTRQQNSAATWRWPHWSPRPAPDRLRLTHLPLVFQYVGEEYSADPAGRYGSYFLDGGAPGGDPWNTQYSSYSPGGLMGTAQASPHYGMTSMADGMVSNLRGPLMW